jgi:hypothetical protein
MIHFSTENISYFSCVLSASLTLLLRTERQKSSKNQNVEEKSTNYIFNTNKTKLRK